MMFRMCFSVKSVKQQDLFNKSLEVPLRTASPFHQTQQTSSQAPTTKSVNLKFFPVAGFFIPWSKKSLQSANRRCLASEPKPICFIENSNAFFLPKHAACPQTSVSRKILDFDWMKTHRLEGYSAASGSMNIQQFSLLKRLQSGGLIIPSYLRLVSTQRAN